MVPTVIDTPPHTKSRLIVAADVGPTIRATAFHEIDSSLRLQCLTDAIPTGGAPQCDFEDGMSMALSELEQSLGVYAEPTLPAPVAITGSRAGAALSTLVVSNLSEEMLLQLAFLLTTNGFGPVRHLSLGAKRGKEQLVPEILTHKILDSSPQVVVFAFSGETAQMNLASCCEILQHALNGRLRNYDPSILILHGGENLDQASFLTGLSDSFRVRMVDIRGLGGGLDIQVSGRALSLLYEDHMDSKVFGGVRPSSLASARIVSLNTALSQAARTLSEENALALAVIHVEAFGATVVVCRQGVVKTGVYGYFESGQSVDHVGTHLDLDELVRWLPSDTTVADAGAYFANRAARPWTLPSNQIELSLEQAASHMALGRAIDRIGEALHPLDLIICTGSTMTRSMQPVQAALTAINACLPGSYCQIALDRSGTLPSEGALLAAGIEFHPGAGLIHVATVLAGTGVDRLGRSAMAVELETDAGEIIRRQVNFGSMDQILWNQSSLATVRGWPSGKLDIGGGPGRATTLRTRILPGYGGLIIDVRGRPIVWPTDVTHRRAAVVQWSQSVDSHLVSASVIDSDHEF